VLASVIGVFCRIFVPMLLGKWYGVLVVPSHGFVGVFALAGSRYFDAELL
jgi:hypothetical protein